MTAAPPSLTITRFTDADWPDIWPLLQNAFADGDSYPCPIDMAEEDALTYWTVPAPGLRKETYVARDTAGAVAGTYYIRADQGGLGDHICNAGYIVAKSHRGAGIAKRLCRHSQDEAIRLGFTGMRYNLVVATNAAAIKAWRHCGMEIVGTIPHAFRHKTLGLVEAHIMYKALGE